MVYPTLEFEMARRKISREELAKSIGKSYSTILLKLADKTPFTWKEAKIIHDKYFPDINIVELFKEYEAQGMED